MAGSNPPNRIHENIVRLFLGRWRVRVWYQRRDNVFSMKGDLDITRVATDSYEATLPELYQSEEDGRAHFISDTLAKLPGVSCVEIVDERTDNGNCFYPDWP